MRIIDICCGGGGAARGYLRAGAGIVVGVDSDAGMRGDFSRAVGDRGIFLHEDALEVLQDPGFLQEFDLIHISPPCQRWSRMANCRPGLSEEYPDLITPSLPLLEASGVPYVIENIVSRGTRALLPGAVTLCGAMFGLRLYRHRLFRSGGWKLTAPEKPAAWAVPPGASARSVRPNPHCGWAHPVTAARAGHWVPGKYVSVSGHERRAVVNEAMQIDWMADREHVKEAIPPQFTQWVGTLFRVAA